MRKSTGLLLTVFLLATRPAFGGTLALNDEAAEWNPVKCIRPLPPPSILDADPETRGESMNQMIAQHNAFVEAAQTYMDCVSNEAVHDQTLINQAIASGAEGRISAVHADVKKARAALRRP